MPHSTESDFKHAHNHHFHNANTTAQHRTTIVAGLTFVMMVAEIIAGYLFGSMALLADGWHMGTHAAALTLAVFAYWFANKYAHSGRYTFGTGKVASLGGFTSAILLAIVAFWMIVESVHRLIASVTIRFTDALIVAGIGLGVNVASALLLRVHHEHDHHHGDHNLRAAYTHVLADALTSCLAIAALFAGMLLGWIWLDPIIGIVGAIVILVWAGSLLRDTSAVLLDAEVHAATDQIRTALAVDTHATITDLHVWQVNHAQFSAIIALVSKQPQPPDYYKKLVAGIPQVVHMTVEVHAAKE
jgi:cation diffusion facilitator family transporter